MHGYEEPIDYKHAVELDLHDGATNGKMPPNLNWVSWMNIRDLKNVFFTLNLQTHDHVLLKYLLSACPEFEN